MAPWPPCAWSLSSLARPSLFGGTAVGRLCLSQCRHQGIKVVLRGKAGLKQAEPVSALSSHLFFDGDGKCMEEAQRAEQRQEPLQAQRRFEEAAQLWQLGTKYSTYHIHCIIARRSGYERSRIGGREALAAEAWAEARPRVERKLREVAQSSLPGLRQAACALSSGLPWTRWPLGPGRAPNPKAALSLSRVARVTVTRHPTRSPASTASASVRGTGALASSARWPWSPSACSARPRRLRDERGVKRGGKRSELVLERRVVTGETPTGCSAPHRGI